MELINQTDKWKHRKHKQKKFEYPKCWNDDEFSII